MVKPIFISKGDGTAYQSGYCVDAAGNLKYTGIISQVPVGDKVIPAPQRIPISNAGQWGVLVMDKMAFQAKFNLPASQPQAATKAMRTDNIQNTPFIISETQSGINELNRMENSKGAQGQGSTMNITLDYRLGAPGTTATIMMGDGAGSLAQIIGVPPLPPGLAIDGDQGANTLAYYLARWNTGRWHRLKGANFQSADALGGTGQAIYLQPRLLTFCKLGDERGTNVTQTPYSFLKNYKGDNFNQAIRYFDDFDFLLSQDSGLLFRVPAGFAISFTTTMFSVNSAQGMVLEQTF